MDPFTISAGISAIGGLFKGITGFFGGNNQAKALKNAGRQADSEAGVAAQQQLAQGEQASAQAATQAAANGGGLGGSSLAVISDLGRQAMFNARAALYRGRTEQQNDFYNAKVAKAQATNGLIGSLIGAGGDVFAGMAQSSLADRQMAALSKLRGDSSMNTDVPY